jgi:hypothetical protein
MNGRFPMKKRSIPNVKRQWLALISVLFLLPYAGISGSASKPDTAKQTIPPYEQKERIASPETFGAGQECYATAYEATTEDDLIHHDIAALLCFSCNKGKMARTCFEARSEPWFHQFVDRLERVPILHEREPREGILFMAMFSGGGGWSKLLTLWVYSKECGQFVNTLPEILITRSGEFKFLSYPKGKHTDVLVVAVQEPDLESRTNVDLCAYRITIYQYSHKAKKFKPVHGGEFMTEKKYLLVSDVEGSTYVIDDQMQRIKRILDHR